ncbi:MAG: cytochrome c3 family protein [bacterium]
MRILLACLFVTVAAPIARAEFDHEFHLDFFPECEACHRGVEQAGTAMFPSPDQCRACHDGDTADEIDWAGRQPSRTNLKFTHPQHQEDSGDAATCTDCHGPVSGKGSTNFRPAASRCADCHDVEEHFDSAEADCAMCHLPLWKATSLTREDVAAFDPPATHAEDGFAQGGHGAWMREAAGGEMPGAKESASCAVCHAKEFCSQCHVNGPETPAIAALGSDPRSLVNQTWLAVPSSHQADRFLEAHGHDGFSTNQCATCHTRESCWVCHAATPAVANGLFGASPDRGVGAQPTRHKPDSHVPGFGTSHGPLATAAPQNCAACHDRSECLDCHRPEGSSASPGFHPAGFLARHPVEAYARETSCAECHHPREFCASCHEQSGLTRQRDSLLGAGFHDGQRTFLFGHGDAARRHLESCVSCHAESDCLTCHSARQGRGFNPHGPGFDAARLAEKAPQMCTVCHGLAIPGRQ